MARIVYAGRALADLERVTDYLIETDPAAALETTQLITSAVQTLSDHPLIGRPYADDIRELVISRGRTGYVALYRYLSQRELVAILSIRYQRESGYLVE